jgi:hypothetical protein
MEITSNPGRALAKETRVHKRVGCAGTRSKGARRRGASGLNSLKTLANIFEMPGRPLPPKALPGPHPFFNNDAVPRPEKTALESVHAFL